MVESGKAFIWRGLVDYTNAKSIELNDDAMVALAKTLWESMDWMTRTTFDVNTEVPAMIAQWVRPDLPTSAGARAWVFFKSESDLEEQFRRQAVRYQSNVRTLLTWLSGQEDNVEMRQEAFGFLFEHTSHTKFQVGEAAYAPEELKHQFFHSDGTLKDDFPRRTSLFEDVADVICDFIQREHKPGRTVPVQICKRPDCSNLVARSKKREYCRTEFCDAARQNRDSAIEKQRNRDKVFLHRLKKLLPATRRKRVVEATDRLRKIEEFWRTANPTISNTASSLLARSRM